MALSLVRSRSNHALFTTCAERFLGDVAASGSPAAHPAQLWLTHRIQRDALLELAAQHNCRGWLNPPIHFLSALPELFAIKGRPLGLLARRELISSIGHTHGRRFGIHIGNADASITRGHMLDSFFGELLPEGITPAVLRDALATLDTDEFATRRNEWIVTCYADYLAQLAAGEAFDARSIHALAAARIEDGGLAAAIGGAARLHIYGLYTARTRRRFISALAGQHEVDVVIYTTSSSDLAPFAPSIDDIASEGGPALVQPAPDANRELGWVAAEIRNLLVSGALQPHEIAVVARSGEEDTRRALHVLEQAGVPATARVRTPLAEIAALKALLDLFRGPAEQWSYRVLRNVLASPYFRTHVDLRPFDYIASQSRPCTLEEWQSALVTLHEKIVRDDLDPDARRIGLNAERVARDVAQFADVRTQLESLQGAKPLGSWLQLALDILRSGWFRLRTTICQAPDERNDVVRLDQRGVRRAEALLTEWSAIDNPDEIISPRDWFRSLRALFEGQELVLTTPGQKGVQILEAHDAALAPFGAVFMVHANDGEFPRRASTSGLFSEEERARLREASLPVDDVQSTLARERVLWDAVAGADGVRISFRTTDARGTPLLASLLVPQENRNAELPRSFEPEQYADRAAMQHAILNAHAEQMRGAPEREAATINPWNGQLRDPAVLERLAAKFNDDYLWSASQLQTYTKAPFLFLLDRVLYVKEVAEAEDDTDALTAGGLAHDILERFFNHYKDALPLAMSEDVQRRLIDMSVDAIRERQQGPGWLGLPVLWEQRRLAVVEMLLEFLDSEITKLHKAKVSVWRCEYVIGGGAEMVELQQNGTRMRLRGRIDRIDRDRNGALTVIDYKSNNTPSGVKEYVDGTALQGPLYVSALNAEGLAATRALYKSIKQIRDSAKLCIDDDEFDVALAAAFSVPSRVRAGLFEAVVAATQKWSDWDPDLAVRRTNAQLEESRFHE